MDDNVRRLTSRAVCTLHSGFGWDFHVPPSFFMNLVPAVSAFSSEPGSGLA
jgi:hypothetical protein